MHGLYEKLASKTLYDNVYGVYMCSFFDRCKPSRPTDMKIEGVWTNQLVRSVDDRSYYWVDKDRNLKKRLVRLKWQITIAIGNCERTITLSAHICISAAVNGSSTVRTITS